jgi:hypothetical protein
MSPINQPNEGELINICKSAPAATACAIGVIILVGFYLIHSNACSPNPGTPQSANCESPYVSTPIAPTRTPTPTMILVPDPVYPGIPVRPVPATPTQTCTGGCVIGPIPTSPYSPVTPGAPTSTGTPVPPPAPSSTRGGGSRNSSSPVERAGSGSSGGGLGSMSPLGGRK